MVIAVLTGMACQQDNPGPSSGGAIDATTLERIEADLEPFSSSDLPNELQDVLQQQELIVFGETHYVQEHQEFLVALLPQLSQMGYRVIFDEMFHSAKWIVNDYINGKIDTVPEYLSYFQDELLRGLKQFNATVPDSLKFQLIYMDLNHWESNFVASLEEAEKVIGPQSLFNTLKHTTVDSPSYRNGLDWVEQELISNRGRYEQMFGLKWYGRLLEMVEVEQLSSDFRLQEGDRNLDREVIMYNNIERFIQNNGKGKYIVNTGMYHGQKEVFMGSRIERIGSMLSAISNQVYSIAFVGIKGEWKLRFYEQEHISFNLAEDASNDNMIKYMAEIARDQQSFLPLTHDHFKNESQRMSYTVGSTIKAPIGRQFDAIVTYPEISVLKSMKNFDWQ